MFTIFFPQMQIQIPLGVQLKNEQVNAEMMDVMDELHKYVPKKTVERSFEVPADGSVIPYKEDYLHSILFGGDQLTCARARSCHRARMNADCASDALAGLVPCCEDWHAKVTFLSVSLIMHACIVHTQHSSYMPCRLVCVRVNAAAACVTTYTLIIQVIWKRLYKAGSFQDAGTLYHLRNTVGRSNVTGSPKDSLNECEDFFFTVVRAHIMAAAMQVLGMESLCEAPKNYVFPDPCDLSSQQREGLLLTPARDVVTKFFSLGLHSSKCLKPFDILCIYIHA